MTDNWTKKLYKEEIKSIYKPKVEKTANEEWQELKEELSLKKIKKGTYSSFKSIIKHLVIYSIILLLILGIVYLGLMIFINYKTN